MDPTNAAVTNFITRAEYESRHSEVKTALTELSTKYDVLIAKIDALSSIVNNQTTEDTKKKARFQTVITFLAGFISSTGVYVVAQYIVAHFVH